MDLNTYLFRESFIDACNSCFVCVNCWFLFLSMFCCCCCLTFVEINIYPFRMKWFDVCISVLHKPPTKYLIYWCKRSVDVRSYSSCSCCSLGVIYICFYFSFIDSTWHCIFITAILHTQTAHTNFILWH